MADGARSASANAAGLSGGTGFAGLVLLMPDGTLRSVLLILSPAITIMITSFWGWLAQEVNERVAEWRLRRLCRKIHVVCQRVLADPHSPEDAKRAATEKLAEIATLEVRLATERARALVSS